MLNKVMNDSDFYCAKIISFYHRLIIREKKTKNFFTKKLKIIQYLNLKLFGMVLYFIKLKMKRMKPLM